ncbi:phosphatase, PAP2_like superfamily protein [Psychroflexus torquis ATCC 700755]|uniref:Phosphatase, PAP2_like superfamily protein n=1 Tax=Psychroflexus torquis (strain ATCC 700755 / CIP 106069 / ACAM 623) TaxID=313595 RepID=K4IJQ6_PSYTT|nr:phosphatase PAP2 family protein [Psychroflexus torquis]AFU69341.1 phosphatase, PAP2_like superfamily protein [Psychroflexus torquis ATCC 700755]
MLETLKQIDRELFLYLNNLGIKEWDWFWVLLTEKETSIPLYAILLFLIFKKIRLRGLLITVVVVALMITFTDQMANFFKDSFQRLRPCNEPFIEYGRFLAKRCGKYGYFSGHAISSFAVATLVSNVLKPYYKYVFYWLFFWAFMVTYSRIYVGVHYPADIFTGAVFGIAIGFLFYKLCKYLRFRFDK